MKNMITYAGLAILGGASLSAAYAPGMSSTQTTKPWSVAASLRGFYDDNYTTANKNSFVGGLEQKRDSFGFSVSPQAALNIFRDQTTFGLSYRYDLRWFEDRRNNSADHSHEASAKLSHAFSPRYKLDASDSFVIAQEPDLLNPAQGNATILSRADGSNIRNDAKVNFSAGLSENFEAVLGYNNLYWDFEQSGNGSYSAILDRVEHTVSLDTRYTIIPSTIGVLGYRYGVADYTSNDLLGGLGSLPSSARDNTSHTAYAGVDHTFNPQLNGSARLGAQFTSYDNLAVSRDTVNPFAEIGATYTYLPGSSASLNARHSRGATTVVTGDAAGLPTLDAESTMAQVSVNHQITAKLNVIGQIGYQYSEFYGGAANNAAESYFFGNLALSYEINKFLAAEAGYNYDNLNSDIFLRGYTRNRVYLGIRASY